MSDTSKQRVTIFVHANNVSLYGTGEKLGLTADALDFFMFTAIREQLAYEVASNGKPALIGVNGMRLSYEPL